MNSQNTTSENSQTSPRSDPKYVTLPFEYYRMLVEHFFTVKPSSIQEEVFEGEDPDPAPLTVGEVLNLKDVNLFDEMPSGYRKLTNNGN